MTIKQLATLCNITPAAIRHYEKLGLFDPGHVVRLPNGYREFTPAAAARLKLIRLGQMSGFRLNEMAGELRRWCDGMTPHQKKEILAQQAKRIDRKIKDLKLAKQQVAQALEIMGQAPH